MIRSCLRSSHWVIAALLVAASQLFGSTPATAQQVAAQIPATPDDVRMTVGKVMWNVARCEGTGGHWNDVMYTKRPQAVCHIASAECGKGLSIGWELQWRPDQNEWVCHKPH